MYRRDYILRLIAQLARALIGLRDRLLKRDLVAVDAREEIGRIAMDAGIDLDLARRLDAGMLVAWLAPTADVDEAKLWLTAELLYLEGLSARSAGAEAEACALFRKVQAVLERVPRDWRPSDDLPTAGERLEEARERLRDTGDDHT